VSKDASTTLSPLARAESSLTSEWVHFCFSSRAVEGANSTQLKGCGSQNYAVHEATASLTSSVSLSGKSQSEKVAVSRIGSKEWIYYHNKWSVQKEPFPAASPGAISSLLRATPTIQKIGFAWVAGQSTTRYRGVFTAADLASRKKSLTPSMVTSLAGLKSDTWTAYVNRAGLIVDVNQTVTVIGSGKTVTVTSTDQFSRYGTPGKVLAPGPNYVSPPKIGSKS
jgi:hypothetical protein